MFAKIVSLSWGEGEQFDNILFESGDGHVNIEFVCQFISFGKTPGFAGGLIEFDSSGKTFQTQCYKLVKITKQETLSQLSDL